MSIWVILIVGLLRVSIAGVESPIISFEGVGSEPKKTLKLVYLKYVKTHDVLPLLRGVCRECDWVVVHSTQAVGLVCPDQDWIRYKAAILALDKRPPMVALSIDIIEVNNIHSERYQQLFSQLTQPMTMTQSIEGMLQLMVSSGNAKVVSSPRLIGRSGHMVELSVGDQIPYQNAIQNTTSIQTNIQYIHSGIELKITPHIHYDERIDLAIHLSYKTVSGYRQDGGVEMPLVASRESKLEIQVTANSTQVFAGLLDQSNHETIEKVPLLADIPWIGELFKKKVVKTRTSDLIYKIRASIIN